MSNSNEHVTKITEPMQACGSIKMLMGLKEETLRIELYQFIKLVAATRKLQKQYYTCQDSARKKQLLIECKQHELRIDRTGNRIWKEQKLGQYEFLSVARISK